MVFRDYLVRCKRCKIPYKPVNMSRIRTCVFCRRKPDITSKEERLNVLVEDIKRFIETEDRLPTKDIVKTWIKLKFEVGESTARSYLNELEARGEIGFINESDMEKIKLLNPVNQPVNA